MSSKLTKAGAASLIVGAAVSTAVLSAGPANAAQVASSQLAPGAQVCAEQYANYQVRVEGLANKSLHFRVFRNGFAIQSYPGSTAFASELRSSWGNFPGPGLLQGLRRQQHRPEQLGLGQHPHRLRDLTTSSRPTAVTTRSWRGSPPLARDWLVAALDCL